MSVKATVPKFAPIRDMALYFDGQGDFVNVANQDILNFSGEITIEAWVFAFADLNLSGDIIDHYNDTQQVFLRIEHTSQRVTYLIGSYSLPGGLHYAGYPMPPEDVENWVHLAGTYDGANWNLYRYGKLVNSTRNTIGAMRVNGDWRIGTSDRTDFRSFNGLINEVRIWNTARLQIEIEGNLYRALAGDEPDLVGYWRLNEGYGDYAFDYTRYGNDGLLVGEVIRPNWNLSGRFYPITSPPARFSLRFNGVNDYMRAKIPAKLAFIAGQPSQITIEAWLYLITTGAVRQMVTLISEESLDSQLFFRVDNGQYSFGAQLGNIVRQVKSPVLPSDLKNWVHLAGTYDGRNWNLYRNGILVNSNAAEGPDIRSNNWNIGASGDGTTNFYQGLLSEVRIWKTARTQVDIFANLHGLLNPHDKHLLAYWRLDEGQGEVAYDSSFGRNNALLGGGMPRWENFIDSDYPKPSKAIYFSGFNSVDFNNPAKITGLAKSPFTVEAWISTEASNSKKHILSFGSPERGQGLLFYVNEASKLAANLSGNPNGPVSVEEADFEWHYVALVNTYDQINNKNSFQLFIDGKEAGLKVTLDDVNVSSGSVFIGRALPGSGDYQGFRGGIADVRIWNTARTAAQIQADMNRETVLRERGDTLGYWKLDEGEGVTVYDYSPNDYRGTLDRAEPGWDLCAKPALAAFRNANDYALQFDGRNKFVSLRDSAALNFSGLITVEAWIYILDANGLYNIVCHGIDAPTKEFLVLRVDGANSPNIVYRFGAHDSSGDYEVTAPMPPSDLGHWVHLAGTYDGADWNLYRNGISIGSSINATGAIQSQEDWAIGSNGNQTGGFFNGLIGEVRIWNIARQQDDIIENVHRELSAKEDGLLGYWRFNEGEGNIAYDATGRGNDGLLGGKEHPNDDSPKWVYCPGTDAGDF
jgi:concanavalin A-like lectin/glucanase superfamily protein